MFDDKLVFSAGSFGDEGIFLYELSPDRLTLLTSDEAWDEYSRFSPDARKIAFGSTQSDKQGIRIMNVDGSGAKPI
jgi:Tol biopolymer transport system component